MCVFKGSWPEATLKKRKKDKKEKKRATCFPTLVQNEFISDVESFTTKVQTYLLQGGEKHNIAIQLVLHQCCKKMHVFCCHVLPYLLIFCRCRRRLTLHNFILLLIFFFKVNYNYINESFPFSPGYIYIVGLPWGKESNT